MEIRALTGFDMQTRKEYGRSYTPLNGCNTILGNIDITKPLITGTSDTKISTSTIVGISIAAIALIIILKNK